MSKDVKSPHHSAARALERDAKAAKAEVEELVQALAALPADMRATVRDKIDSARSRLEAIDAQAERALDEQRIDFATRLARLEEQLEQQADDEQRRRIEASKAQAQTAYQISRHALENARSTAKDGAEFSAEALGVYSRAFEAIS